MKSSTSGRLACVDLPAFPLQLLLRRHPDWVAQPAAVVAEDKPQGLILWVNERARQSGVLPGLRYAAALSLAAGLRAGEVEPREIAQSVSEVTRRLMRFSPEVEPAEGEPGVFWLNGAGLQRLYQSPRGWANAIHEEIIQQSFTAGIVVGFSRFGTYAVAKAHQSIVLFRDVAEERSAAEKISLSRLNIDSRFRDALFKLGIETVGDLLALPPAGLRERFGVAAHRLHQLAADKLWSPLAPTKPEEPVAQKRILDDPESDVTRLLFLLKQMLYPMLVILAKRAQALTALWLSFLIDDGSWLKEQIRPAAPTLAEAQIMDLIRLRLESLKLAAGVIEIALQAESSTATREQLRLFAEQPKRDLDAANRALARLRAEFGDEAVVRAALKDGHLPEARFAWEPIDRVQLPRLNQSPVAFSPDDLNGLHVLSSPTLRVLVRRITAKPIMLPGTPAHTHEDGWLLLGPKYGSVDRLIGPFIFSGGWWHREIQREYYYAETRRGDLLWIYYDRVIRRWFLQGAIE
jgi:protein ImuB